MGYWQFQLLGFAVPRHIFVNPYYSARPVCWRNARTNGVFLVFFSNVIQSKVILRCWIDCCGVCRASAYLPHSMIKSSTVSGISHVSHRPSVWRPILRRWEWSLKRPVRNRNIAEAMGIFVWVETIFGQNIL